MILTVASFKGGVAKSTTAIHLAAYFAEEAPTVLVDGDPNRSATSWAGKGKLPFRVVDERMGMQAARECEHLIIDTKARPEPEDLRALAMGCDLLIIPTTPDPLALEALMLTVSALQEMKTGRFRVLLTIVPPKPIPEGEQAREALTEAGLPLFASDIRRLMAFQRAALEGVTVDRVRDARAMLGWKDYLQVAEEAKRLTAQTARRQTA